eukprot:CAMPEP_0198425244 /NCGR_PEP_ID=MMETSP1452-20131203/4434_1 /TAXON_ID=1181717 /ORGANISM="Synchroma pusillum, Strain CCMP3072" /LENGTH=75 /DNA_ID=CAMNT_0044145599 /DNA_START=53 /DNA_END=276 /DNA_ORIENTATION=+
MQRATTLAKSTRGGAAEGESSGLRPAHRTSASPAKPKGGKAGGRGKGEGKKSTRSSKAGLQFPVGRIGRYLKQGR